MIINKKDLNYQLKENIELHKSLAFNEDQILGIIKKITLSIKKGGKILICGNGGSSADASHLAAEFLVRLTSYKNRPPIAAIPLTIDTPTLTACSNDYGFKYIFLRNFQALAKKNDILLIISTSGNSENILELIKFAKGKNHIVGFLGNKGGKAKKYCDSSIIVKSKNVARIQECHIFLGHFIFQAVEKNIFK